MVTEDGFRRGINRRALLEAGAFSALLILVAISAIAVKESRATLRPLVAIDDATTAELNAEIAIGGHTPDLDAPADDPLNPKSRIQNSKSEADLFASAEAAPSAPGVVRWFNGRPVRQVRAVEMVVTAYSPDDRSCPGSADGITATLHSVATNGMALVAADPRVLPYGSMLTIPGYDDGNIVPVLDCGGAIKNNRLDLLFPTHEAARQWGRKTLRVIVWQYADGAAAENPRHVR
jgi:3D (Asp-Asp-Asp) domain-containing protein